MLDPYLIATVKPNQKKNKNESELSTVESVATKHPWTGTISVLQTGGGGGGGGEWALNGFCPNTESSIRPPP